MHLQLRDALPEVIEGWIHIDEVAYNGESSAPEDPDLSYFREAQGMAYALEELAGAPLRQAVTLTGAQHQYLKTRARNATPGAPDGSRAILVALGLGVE